MVALTKPPLGERVGGAASRVKQAYQVAELVRGGQAGQISAIDTYDLALPACRVARVITDADLAAAGGDEETVAVAEGALVTAKVDQAGRVPRCAAPRPTVILQQPAR